MPGMFTYKSKKIALTWKHTKNSELDIHTWLCLAHINCFRNEEHVTIWAVASARRHLCWHVNTLITFQQTMHVFFLFCLFMNANSVSSLYCALIRFSVLGLFLFRHRQESSALQAYWRQVCMLVHNAMYPWIYTYENKYQHAHGQIWRDGQQQGTPQLSLLVYAHACVSGPILSFYLEAFAVHS